MHRNLLLDKLSHYGDTWSKGDHSFPRHDPHEEQRAISDIRAFVQEHEDCFERSCLPGHITGAALVVSPDLQRVLLTHHRKLNLWLQLGGHADGDSQVHQVAMREAEEESGLEDLSFLNYEQILKIPTVVENQEPLPQPFDLDVHKIPANSKEPAHYHYDIRYLVVAAHPERIVCSDESHEIRWFTLDEARAANDERSMARQFDKLEYIRKHL